MTTIDKTLYDRVENDIEARMDKRVEADTQYEVFERVWTKVGVRFWTFQDIMPRINA